MSSGSHIGASSATRPAARTAIAVRILGGIFGGYGLAAVLAMALARILPGAASETVIWATLAAVPAMPAAILWMFGARDVRTAGGWLALLIGATALCAWAAGGPA